MSARIGRRLELAEPLDPTNPGRCRLYVSHGLCPICGHGPFRSVAMHASKVHEVDRFQLRDMLGVIKYASVCDPEHSDACRERAAERYRAGQHGLRPPRQGDARTFGVRGREIQRAKLGSIPADQRAATRAAIVQRQKAVARRRHLRFAEEWAAGDPLYVIATRHGVHAVTVRAALRALGVDISRARSRAMRQRVLDARP